MFCSWKKIKGIFCKQRPSEVGDDCLVLLLHDRISDMIIERSLVHNAQERSIAHDKAKADREQRNKGARDNGLCRLTAHAEAVPWLYIKARAAAEYWVTKGAWTRFIK